MKWYVRDLSGEGSLLGPYDRDEALSVADRVDGSVFSEELLKPRFTSSDEADALLRELHDLRGMVSKSHDSTADASRILAFCDEGEMTNLLQQASDMIVLLSREKLVTGRIESGVLDFDPLPQGVRIKVDDYDVEGCANPDDLERDDEDRLHTPLEFVSQE